MGSGSSKRGGGPAAARAATHRFEFDLNGHHYSFDTVQSDIEIETYPPYQIFELTSKATVPLKEEDEVLNFTIYNLGAPSDAKVTPRLTAKDFLRKLTTSYVGSSNADGEVREEWAEWEKTGRTSICIAAFDINAREVPGSGYDREDPGYDCEEEGGS
ncbi:unnamed protein product [Symbiodinium natans]|uniref:Uncharacterized protein n=1 Tax=Symbiodinium natans TaxID=878477 RepID=A0A812PES7_9DINO|nr:unnamed protein product [Symbiodinium natans]